MSYKIVFFDIDGTLMNGEKVVPASTKQAIEKLRENNVEVAIATGRAPFNLDTVAAELGIDSYISYNGSYVVHKGQLIYKSPISKATLQQLEQHAGEKQHPVVFLGAEAGNANYEGHPHILDSFRSLKVDAPGYHPAYWQEAEIFQALLYCEEQDEQRYIGNYPDLSFIRWHKYSLDVIPAGGSKARGIEKMLQHLQLTPEQAVAFGDGLNDTEMLSFAGMGIAMGNAHDEVKPYANFVTKHVDDGGIYYGLQHLGLIK